MIEEKKLTDEEIVEVLELCGNRQTAIHDCKKCPLYMGNCGYLCKVGTLEKYALDLIRRLQSENAELKAKRKKILANRVYSDATLKSWRKEDLIEQIRILEHNWAAAEESLNNSAKNSEKIFYEQKAEIERLTMFLQTFETVLKEKEDLIEKGVEEEYADFMRRYRSAQDDIKTFLENNVELQKQVDEYKNKIEQGTLKELPCKVGDTVYVLAGCILHYEKVWQVKYTERGFFVNVSGVYPYDYKWGETAFLTREEAEKRLKELQE